MSAMERGEGLQVVKLGGVEQRYQVNEQALEQVLMRPDVRDRSVVIVSVAGAYRGGKSFILDFFLRYLNAPRSSQASGEWLGLEDQPLEGFHWRGGCERDTTGIHLWSQPILTTLETTGEKVAVLLMDTQGTFDSESTIGENSTVFALSTLISSVQLYNLSANIKEDDLQHLQLFTEYGKLACDTDGKAFQTLIFLVRDWMSEYEHAYGFEGGKTLLNRRLESKVNQKQELREVREHIRSCFDEIKCFLMPHPGLNVANLNFAGCLRDVTEKFRLALLELVPSLFDPSHLTPKLINGERVKARDLLFYFKKYVDIFNSEALPEATTIFKATAEACQLAALREARDAYEACMLQHVSDHVSVPPRSLAHWHQTAADRALQLYNAKKKLGSQQDIDYHREQLKKELEAHRSLYQMNNEAKIRDTVQRAVKAYESAVNAVCPEQARLCLHPTDLTELHDEALDAALKLFGAERHVPDQGEDEEKADLVQNLKQRYRHLCRQNEQNNAHAVVEARELYALRMREHAGVALSAERLQQSHGGAMAAARMSFLQRRNRDTQRDGDIYLQRLLEEINDSYSEFEKSNLNSNKMALQAAEYKYNNLMSTSWGPQSCCFHPNALADLHKNSLRDTVNDFLAGRPHTEHDEYKEKLVEILESRYAELKRINEYNNNQAVELAFGVYTRLMDKHSQPSLGSILIAPFLIKLMLMLPKHHQKAVDAACKVFSDKRRGPRYDHDEYREQLLEKMNDAFQNYRNPILALMRELGLHVEDMQYQL